MPDTLLLVQMMGRLLVIGAFAGVLAGWLGVGGGIVLVPAFFYAFQTLGYGGPQLMQLCLATSLATIIVILWISETMKFKGSVHEGRSRKPVCRAG